MRKLEKLTLDGIRYIVWDERQGACPGEEGTSLLLSGREGVGGDVLLALPKGRPLAVRAYAKDGHELAADDAARRAAFLALGCSANAGAVAAPAADRVEVRLTDAFCARLFSAGCRARIAG